MRFLPSDDTTPKGVVFKSLSKCLKSVDKNKLAEAISKLQSKPLADVINDFRTSFYSSKRIAAFACSEALTAMGVPPAFRHSHLSRTDFTLEQKLDLLTYDIRWIRRQHRDHVKKVRYGRYKDMLSLLDSTHHAAVEYAFFDGQRPNWKIVSSLNLPESIQFECAVLHSAVVNKRQQVTNEMRDEVYSMLREHIKGVRKTRTFTKEDAAQTLKRRHDIWFCSRMCNGSRTEIAKIYRAKTGEVIRAEVVGRQLEIINEIIRK